MIVISKKTLMVFLTSVVATVFCTFGVLNYAKNVFSNNDKPTVIIDAGHGAPDGGAVGVNGTLEKDINLAISLKIEEVLTAKDIRVIMTRVGDSGLYQDKDGTLRQQKREDMNTRLSIMKKSDADLFVSIHMNSFTNKNAQGLHVFYSEKHEEIKPLAENIQNRIAEITGAETHAVKTANKNLFLMKNPPLPSILVECGFISNPEEEKKLNDEDYQSRIAWAISEEIESFFNPN